MMRRGVFVACVAWVVAMSADAVAQDEGTRGEVQIDEGEAGEFEVEAGEEPKGALEGAVIRRVVASRRKAYRACFEKGAVKGRLPGKVSIRFVIGPDGVVESATVEGEGAEGVAECLERELEALVFPAPRGGGKVVVAYPWNIGPSQ